MGISAYWTRKPFQTIQFGLVNWFVWFTKDPVKSFAIWFVCELDITSKQAALPLQTLICIIQRQDENKNYHLNFSKHTKFPSDIHSYKLLPLTESRFVYHLNRFESSHV